MTFDIQTQKGRHSRRVVYYVEIKPCWWIPFGFPRRKWIPFINMYKGRVYDVTHCFNQEKKCVLPY